MVLLPYTGGIEWWLVIVYPFRKRREHGKKVNRLPDRVSSRHTRTLGHKPPQTSAAQSISAWYAFFPWPIIVAAIMWYRYGPRIMAAARWKIAARSWREVRAHCFLAPRAPRMAFSTSSGVACEYLASASLWSNGVPWISFASPTTCYTSVSPDHV